MRSFTVASMLVLITVGGALADRPLTDQEKARLAEAVTAQGCSGGKMKIEEEKFEVDGATCAGGKKYDLEFDKSFKLIAKEEPD